MESTKGLDNFDGEKHNIDDSAYVTIPNYDEEIDR